MDQSPHRPRRVGRWLVAAGGVLVVGLVLVLVVRPLVDPRAGRESLEREATAVMGALGLQAQAGENNLGEWSVGAKDGMTVEATKEGNTQAAERVATALRERGWLVVDPGNELADAAMLVKAYKVVGGRLATVEMIAPMHPVTAEEREPTFQASLRFFFNGDH